MSTSWSGFRNSVAGLACGAMVLVSGGAACAADGVKMKVSKDPSSFVDVLIHAKEWAGTMGFVEVVVPERHAGDFETITVDYMKAVAEGGAVVKPEGLVLGFIDGFAPPERAAAQGFKFFLSSTATTQPMVDQITQVWNAAGLNTGEMVTGPMNIGEAHNIKYFDGVLYPYMTGGAFAALKKEPFVAVAYADNDGIAGQLAMKGAPYTVSADGGKVDVLGQEFDPDATLAYFGLKGQLQEVGDSAEARTNARLEKLREFFSDDVAECIATARGSSDSMRECFNKHANREEGASWFPRTRESVEATKYHYGLNVKPPLERLVENQSR